MHLTPLLQTIEDRSLYPQSAFSIKIQQLSGHSDQVGLFFWSIEIQFNGSKYITETMILLGSIQSNELQLAIDTYQEAATAARQQSGENSRDIPITMVTPPTPTPEKTHEVKY